MTAKEIIEETNTLIDTFENDLSLLNEKCIEYIQTYDEHVQSNMYDGSLLKERMKSALIEAVPNDI